MFKFLEKFLPLVFFVFLTGTGLRSLAFAAPASKYRGWDYLALKLKSDGIPENTISSIYSNKRMPVFEPVPFALNPKESGTMYTHFLSPKKINAARNYLKNYRIAFSGAEHSFAVDRKIICAIILVESQLGRYTGTQSIVVRLSRLASIADPENVKANFKRLKKEGEDVTLEGLMNRARYLEKTFYPEIPAIIQIAKHNGFNIFNIKGSYAGAFGLPQFLPSSYLKFGIDGNRDGHISLFTPEDAIYSVANFLAGNGWKPGLGKSSQEKVLWQYNKSNAYIDTVLQVARRL